MSTALTTLTTKLSSRLDIGGDSRELIDTLKATAFKGQVSDCQMTALMIVANQYGLNPWTKEIYAFPDKNNGIIPVVGVDGWARIINNHPQFDGMEFDQDEEFCTCRMYRKDRSRAVSVTEFMSECRRANAGPWGTHPKRMLRHKAMIQCARLAFGYVGIFEPDEAERIVEKDMGAAEVILAAPKPEASAYPSDLFASNLPKWRAAIAAGKKSAEDIIAMVQSKGTLTDAQKAAIREVPPAPSRFEQTKTSLIRAQDQDTLNATADLIGELGSESERAELTAIYHQRREQLDA